METKGMGKLFGCITACILLGCVQAEKIDRSHTIPTTYDILVYGAVGDGKTLNTRAIPFFDVQVANPRLYHSLQWLPGD